MFEEPGAGNSAKNDLEPEGGRSSLLSFDLPRSHTNPKSPIVVKLVWQPYLAEGDAELRVTFPKPLNNRTRACDISAHFYTTCIPAHLAHKYFNIRDAESLELD